MSEAQEFAALFVVGTKAQSRFSEKQLETAAKIAFFNALDHQQLPGQGVLLLVDLLLTLKKSDCLLETGEEMIRVTGMVGPA